MTNLDCMSLSRARLTRCVLGATLAVVIVAQGLAHSVAADTQPAQITWTKDECDADAACVTADGSKRRGSADLRGQGFLHGLTETTDAARVEALKPKHWRLADESTYDLARAHGARITWVISDSWWQTSCQNGRTPCPLPPWENWELYDSFVRSLVLWSLGTDRPVDYWDVVNEPPSKQTGSGTPEQYYEQLRHAHDAIRSVDPDAKIVAPSLTTYADVLPSDGYRSSRNNLELKTMLDFAVANDLRFDAISWHENTAHPLEPFPTRRPSDIVDHVAQARALLAEYPTLGPVEVHINEYTPQRSRNIPGWITGWIAGVEDADVDVSMRTCWAENEPGKAKYTGCRPFGMLDGLLERDERTPRPAYWVYESYADMTGDRLNASTNDPTVSVFATTDDSAKQLRLLVGRHERCTKVTSPECVQTETAPPRSIDVRLRLPWQRVVARAEVKKITNQAASMPEAPPVVATVEHVPDNWSTIHLPDVADGDAYSITVRPIAEAPTLSINNVVVQEGAAGGVGKATFTVTKAGQIDRPVTVKVATANELAMSDDDYTGAEAVLEFAPDESVKQVSVDVLGDDLDEGDETFVVQLSDATNAVIDDATGFGTITDDDVVTLAINDVKLIEGNSDATTAELTVTKTGETVRTVTARHSTANKTAWRNLDYIPGEGELSFAPDETTKTITVDVLGDVLDETTETFYVNLFAATNARITDRKGVLTVLDNDVRPAVAIGNGTVKELSNNSCNLTVKLSAVSGRKVGVRYSTINGAAGSSDYAAKSGEITFAPGESSKVVKIYARSDAIKEGTETFTVKLSAVDPSDAASIADATGICSILDND